MPRRVDDRPRIGLEGLHEHAARRIAAAAPGELRDQLERSLLRPKVGQPEARVRVHDGGQLDAGEVVALRHHLRAEQHRARRRRGSAQATGELLRPGDRVGVEPDQLELGQLALELPFEPLRPRPEARELRRPARLAGRRRLPLVAAVVAAKRRVAVQDERDVAVRAADRRPAGAAVERRRDAAAVQQQDRLAAMLGDPAQRAQQRRRERVAGLAPQIDHLHRRQVGADPPAELEPLERRPALRPRRRRAEHGHGAFERGTLRGDRARVIARIGVLLVGGSCSSSTTIRPSPRIGAKIAERAPTTMRASPLAIRCALVTALRVGERRMQDRHPVAEARAHAADRLRRERDLGHEHDRAEAALEHRGARLQVHLGLPGAGRAVEQERSRSAVSTIRSTAAICEPESSSGSASPASACRSAGGACSLRRFGVSGATRASARAGVEP